MSMERIIGPSEAETGSAAPFLSGIEWSAVLVALRDSDRGLAPTASDGRIVRAWRWLTGNQPPRPLADARLDTLRRFVMNVRENGGRMADMMPEMRSRGFSREQVEALARVVA